MITALMLLIQLAGTFLWAATFSELWGWFVVPLNDAIPAIGIVHAWGLQTTLNALLTARGFWGDIQARIEMKREDPIAERILIALMCVLAPAIVYIVGFIAKAWM